MRSTSGSWIPTLRGRGTGGSVRSSRARSGYHAGVATTEEKAPGRKQRQREARDEARRQLALSQVRRYPDPALRQRAREIEEFSEDLKVLAERMGRIMMDADGVGLAGPQLGLLRRILVFRARDEDEVTTLVNPVIASSGEETETDLQGCLSLPNVAVAVERPT